MPTPAWFQATDYFYNKLAQMQATDNAYTAQQLVDAFNQGGYGVQGTQPAQLAASSEGLFRHFNEYGNAEDVSPNNYFDLATYRANKLAQVKTTGQTPPDGFQTWTEDALDAAMANAGLSYWDHYIQYGTMEGINPSASFITNDYLSDKLAQLNGLQPPQPLPDGSIGEWKRADLCEALRDANLSALEHYMLYNTMENIGYVPGPENPARNVNLTTGTDVLYDNGVPTNFIADVEQSASKSTLNAADQINGSHEDDVLTVNMKSGFTGFNDDGFVNGVSSVNLVNKAANGDVVDFNAQNVSGVKTYNIDGSVSLSNLANTDAVLEYSNVNNTALNVGFQAGAVSGSDDSLSIVSNNSRLGVVATDIEHLDYESAGGGSNSMEVKLDGLKSLTVTGDTYFNARTYSYDLTTTDMSGLSGGSFLCMRRVDQAENVKLGSGDDTLALQKMLPNVTIDGGAGNDTVKFVNTPEGAYQPHMTNVETLAVSIGGVLNMQEEWPAPDNDATLSIDGTYIDGLQTLKLGGNGEAGSNRAINLVNYDASELNVTATGKNYADLTITDIKKANLKVGDGDNSTTDLVNGSVTLTDATQVALNVSDNQKAGFDAALNAAKATSISLANGQESTLKVNGGDLSAVSSLNVSGYGDVSISGAKLGANAGSVTVDAGNLIGGSFTAQFVDNKTENGADLDFTGSATGESILTVDETYSTISVNTGISDDTLTLDAGAGDGFKYTKQNLTGSLGYGNDTVIVKGNVLPESDFSGLTGVEKFIIDGKTTAQAQTWVADNNIVLPDGITAADVIGGDSVGVQDLPDNGNPGTVVTETGVPVVGDINTTDKVAFDGSKSGVDVAFGTGTKDVKVTESGDMTITGGPQANTITGDLTATQLQGKYTIDNSAGKAADTIDQSVAATGDVTVTGNGNKDSIFDFTVTGGESATIDAGQAKDAAVAVSGVAGPVAVTTGNNGSTVTVGSEDPAEPKPTDVDVTTGAGADTVAVNNATGNVTVNTGAGDDKATLTGFDGTGGNELSVDLGEGTNTLVADDQNLTGTDATIKNANIAIGKDKTFNLGDNWDNLEGVSIAGPGALEFTSGVDLSKVTSVPVTADMVIGKDTTVDVGANLGTEGQLNPTSITGAGTLNIKTGDVNLAGENAPTVSTAIQVATGASLAMGANLKDATAISGEGTLKVSASATAPAAAKIDVADVNVGENATLTVDAAAFGQTNKFVADTVDGEGTLKLTGNATLLATTQEIKTATLDIAGKLVVADKFNTIDGGTTITGDGTLDFSQDATIFAAGDPTIETAIQVDDGATLTLTQGAALTAWLGEGKQVTGDGIVAFDAAANLSTATALPFASTVTLSTDGGAVTFGDNINGAEFKVTKGDGGNDNALIVDLTTTDATVDISGLSAGTDGAPKIEVKADSGDTITLGEMAETVVISNAVPAPEMALDGVTGVVISGFASNGSDKIDFAGAYSGYGSEDWADAITIGGTEGTASEAQDSDGSASATANVLGDGKLYYLSGDDNISGLTEASAIADLFTSVSVSVWASGSENSDANNSAATGFAEKYFLAEGSDAMLVTSAGSNSYKLWYIDNKEGAQVEANEITLIGTINSDGEIANNWFAAGE